jgi:hypothetical protein
VRQLGRRPPPSGILSHLAQFDGGSLYYAINSTYYDSTNTHISNSINFGPSNTDNYSLGKELNLSWQDVQEIP